MIGSNHLQFPSQMALEACFLANEITSEDLNNLRCNRAKV